MSANFTNNGDGTGTVTFEYTRDLTKLSVVLDAAAKILYSRYPVMVADPTDTGNNYVPFDDLTNQQKLDILDQHVISDLKGWALRQLNDDTSKTALDSADNESAVDI